MIEQQLLLEGCQKFGIELPPSAPDKLDRYAQLLVEWNQKMNLTAITEPQEIVWKHFVDSLLLLKAAELPQGASLIDVGTGAGFPSMPVKIAREDLKVTMLDSLQKRLTFLAEVNDQLGLDCSFVHSRAEDGGKQKNLRERFDFATARAVANLRDLAEYCLPYVRVGGSFIALKGPDVEEEVREAKNAIATMGGKVEKGYPLPCRMRVEETSSSSGKYRRLRHNSPELRQKWQKNPFNKTEFGSRGRKRANDFAGNQEYSVL